MGGPNGQESAAVEEMEDGEDEEEEWEEEEDDDDDCVEVVSENICLLLDDSEEEAAPAMTAETKHKNKKEKKAAKEQKKRQKIVEEGKRRRQHRLQKKEIMNAKICKEAAQEAHLIADEALRRQARRLEAYDKGVLSSTKSSTETQTANVSKVVEGVKRDQKKAAIEARKAKRLKIEMERNMVNAPPSSETGEIPQDAPPSPVNGGLPTDANNAHSIPDHVPDEVPPNAVNDDPKAMAAAIAELHLTKDSITDLPTFATFAKFNAQAAHQKAHGEIQQDASSSSEEDSADEQSGRPQLPKELYSLQGALPQDLPTLDAISKEPGLYVAHFIRFVVGAWHVALKSGEAFEDARLTWQTKEILKSESKFQETAGALRPLLTKLRHREIRQETLDILVEVVELAVARDYTGCNASYVKITMGKKLWHNGFMQTMMQQNHGGGIKKINVSSELIDFDRDPVQQAYMWSFKRLMQFLQYIRPATDITKQFS